MKEVNFKEEKLVQDYLDKDRWAQIKRNYTSNDVASLRTPFKVSHTIAEKGSESLWELLNREDAWVSGLGAATIQQGCLLYTSPSPRDRTRSRMPSSA